MIRNHMMTSLAAVALLTSTAACARQSEENADPANEPGAGEVAEEAAAETGEVIEDVGEAVAEGAEEAIEAVGDVLDKEVGELNARGMTVRNILGEDVRTSDGRFAARVDDVLFDADGRPSLAVLKEGGLFGVGDSEIVITIQRLRLLADNKGEIAAEVSLTNAELEKLGDGAAFMPADFSVGGKVDVALLSARKLLATSVVNTQSEKVADIYDLVLGPEWEIDQVVLSRGGVANIGDRLIAVPWSSFAMTEAGDAMQTIPSAVDFERLPRFSYDALING